MLAECVQESTSPAAPQVAGMSSVQLCSTPMYISEDICLSLSLY